MENSCTSSVLRGVEATLGKELTQKIQSCRILVVGAGGIGCELLKNLALTGFTDVRVVDLDTIDVSNLNRQLLFRSKHVGMPKCTVACEVATEMANACGFKVNYQAQHGNICDSSQFHVQYFAQFDLVLSALDNIQARQRVNRLCLAADVPLVEAGTTGYLGQVNVIHRPSQTACYECKPPVTQKVYPICTIRSTPSMPVHTIVWAKELYKLLFAEKTEESMLYEDPNGEEPSTYMGSVLRLRQEMILAKTQTEDTDANATTLSTDVILQLIHDLYVKEIQKQLNMDRYKAAHKTPKPLDCTTLLSKETLVQAPTQRNGYDIDQIWSPQDCIAEVIACLSDTSMSPLPAFDKDDALSMRFVTATSNLRSHVFGIEPLQSYYSAKGIAGNIIPAIATTNAIAAGLQILQCFHILRAQLEGKPPSQFAEHCRYVAINRQIMRNGLVLTAGAMDAPNPQCYVCRNAALPLSLDTTQWTLQDLIVRVLKQDLGFQEPSILLEDDFIYEEGEGADDSFAVNLPKTLDKLPGSGVKHGSVLEISDNTLDLEVHILISHQVDFEKDSSVEDASDEPLPYTLGARKEVVTSAVPATMAAAYNGSRSDRDNEDNDDDIVVVVGATKVGESRDSKKRSGVDASLGEREGKRIKRTQEDIILLD